MQEYPVHVLIAVMVMAMSMRMGVHGFGGCCWYRGVRRWRRAGVEVVVKVGMIMLVVMMIRVVVLFVIMRMARVIVRSGRMPMIVTVIMASMRMAVPVVGVAEGKHTDQVHCKAESTDSQELPKPLHLTSLRQSLDCLVDDLNADKPAQ